MKRTISILLLIAMLLGTVSCGKETVNEKDQENDTTVSTQDTSAETPEAETEKTPTVGDLLPAANFDGATVLITMDGFSADYAPADEYSGVDINDALVDRKRAVEALYNVELEYNILSPGTLEPREQYTTWSAAGDDTNKLYYSRTRYMAEYITSNIARSWSDYPEIIDFEADWFNTYAINTFSIGDKVKMLYGDLNESSIRFAWIWLYNKGLAEDYGITNLYEVVDEGKWTMDYLMDITSNIYKDFDGNGERDENDIYGYVSDIAASFDHWGPTLKLSPVIKDENDYPVVVDAISEHTVNGFEKLYKLIYENNGTYVFNGAFTQLGAMFVPGKAVITNTTISSLEGDDVREMVDFGVLPTPKMNEDQDTYYTHTDCMFTCLLLPSVISEEDALRSVYIANALNAFSHEMVLPVYYETVLKTKLTRDTDAPRMLDLVLEGRRYGFEYFAESAFPITHYSLLRVPLQSQKDTCVSMYTSKLRACGPWIERFLNKWKELD